jgi:hypothetical protein
LELVIERAAHVLVRVFDDGHHEIRGLAFAEPEREAVAQSAHRGFALKAGEARPEHELHGRDELGRVRAQREEGGDAELLEERVALRGSAAHQHDHFMVQLEGAGLELDAARTCKLFCQLHAACDDRQNGERTYLCRTRSRNLGRMFSTDSQPTAVKWGNEPT